MSKNPHVKQLHPFDPKNDLRVNEKFSAAQMGQEGDDLSILEADDELDESTNSGKEMTAFKTDGAVIAGVQSLENNRNKTILLVATKMGSLYLLTPEGDSLKTLAQFRVPGSILHTPGYADGIIYCTTREGAIFAINTGLQDEKQKSAVIKPKILWQVKTKKGILTEPLATGKMLFIATLGGLYCFQAYYQDESNKSIGKQLWAKRLNGVVSSPRLFAGNIFIGTEKSRFLAFDYGGSRASQCWGFKASGAIRSKPCVSKKQGLALAPTIDGYIYAVDLRTGKYRWSFVVKAPVYSNIITASIGNEDHFFFGADDGVFYCLNSVGKKLWSFKANGKIRTEALVKGPRIYFGAEDNTLYVLNIRNGKEIFHFTTDGNINSRPVIVDDIIYFGSTDFFVHGVYI